MSASTYRPDRLWENLGDGLERTRVEGGWIYRNIPTGSICFAPEDAPASILPPPSSLGPARAGLS